MAADNDEQSLDSRDMPQQSTDIEGGVSADDTSTRLVERLDSGDIPQHPAYIEEDIADEKKKVLLERFDSGEIPRDEHLDAQAQSDDISKKKILDDINQPTNTLNPPTPFNYVEHETDNEEEVNMQMVNRKIGREIQAVSSTVEQNNNTTQTPNENRDGEEDMPQPPTTVNETNFNDSASLLSRSMIIQASVHRAVSLEQNVPVYQEQGEYAAIIPEAFLVEPEEQKEIEPIIISGEAELISPWYKQIRTYIFIGLFVIVVLGLGIGLGLRPNKVVVAPIPTSTPSVSSQPSSSPSEELEEPSYSPSISSAPSPVPSTLLNRLYNEQNVALNGTNMVMVTQTNVWDPLDIVFYSLENGILTPVSAFIEESYYHDKLTISINDTTTILNFTRKPTPSPTPFPTTPFPVFSPTDNVRRLNQRALVIAVDDPISLQSGTIEAFIAVLENDTGSNLIVRAITSQPTNGQCSISLSRSEVVYVPNDTTFVGSDQCTYETCDDEEDCDTAIVRINIGSGGEANPSTSISPPSPLTPIPTYAPITPSPTYDCDVENEYLLYTRTGDSLNSTWELEDDTRCPFTPFEGGGSNVASGGAGLRLTPEPTATPIAEEIDSSTSPLIIIISVLIPLLFCVLPMSIYIYLRHKRSSKDQAEVNNDETEQMLALKCPVCSAVTDENYFLIPCGHFACAKCSAEYESQPCPTCHGALTGRHKVTCKTSLA